MRVLIAIVLILLVSPLIAVDAARSGNGAAISLTKYAAKLSGAAQSTAAATSASKHDPLVFSWAYWDVGKRADNLRNALLVAIALVGLLVGTWRAYTAHQQANASNRLAKVAEQGHFTERFSKTIEHLGNDQLPIRLGGIYALWRLAEDSPTPDSDWARVLDILCAFVRNPPHPDSGNNFVNYPVSDHKYITVPYPTDALISGVSVCPMTS